MEFLTKGMHFKRYLPDDFFSFNELVLTHQVRCNNGSETEVPGVILVIPPPDKKAVQQVQRSENNTSKGKIFN